MNLRELYNNILEGKLSNASKPLSSHLFFNLLITIIFSGIFGFIVGTYGGGIQLVYTAIKVPLLMFVTTLITLPFMFIVSIIIENKATPAFTTNIINYTLTQTSLMMFGLSPLMWVFIQTNDYRINILALSLIFIISGGFAIVRTGKAIRENLETTGLKLIMLSIACGVIYTFVAGQVWWLMRPWVGYTVKERDLPFIRPLDDDEINNVYESIQLSGETWYERNILNQ
jgi:hypothetical protein